MELFVKNMVCPRCIHAVQTILSNNNIKVSNIELGRVITVNIIPDTELERLNTELVKIGFEILTDKKDKIIQQIKDEIISLIHYNEAIPAVNLSSYLSDKLGYEYNYLSNLFSEHEKTTIEKYFILQRIEKVKELLSYNELTLSEIAYKLGYSSTAYLSSQFKKITGLTPTLFLAGNKSKRSNINDL